MTSREQDITIEDRSIELGAARVEVAPLGPASVKAVAARYLGPGGEQLALDRVQEDGHHHPIEYQGGRWRRYAGGAVALIAAALLVAPAGAGAAGPALTLERADRAATRYLQAEVRWWNHEAELDRQDWEAEGQPASWEHATTVTRWELDPCERVRRRRAECDYTWWTDDGERCDYLLEMTTTRRNRIAYLDDFEACDGDDLERSAG